MLSFVMTLVMWMVYVAKMEIEGERRKKRKGEEKGEERGPIQPSLLSGLYLLVFFLKNIIETTCIDTNFGTMHSPSWFHKPPKWDGMTGTICFVPKLALIWVLGH